VWPWRTCFLNGLRLSENGPVGTVSLQDGGSKPEVSYRGTFCVEYVVSLVIRTLYTLVQHVTSKHLLTHDRGIVKTPISAMFINHDYRPILNFPQTASLVTCTNFQDGGCKAGVVFFTHSFFSIVWDYSRHVPLYSILFQD